MDLGGAAGVFKESRTSSAERLKDRHGTQISRLGLLRMLVGLDWELFWNNYIKQKWKTVAVWSRTLNSCQRNYSILDKEWLAILEAVTRIWRHWLIGREFEIQTDHSPLCQILARKAEDLTPRQLRWLEKMEPFSYTMSYLKGEENIVADALSRNVDALAIEIMENVNILDKDEIIHAAQTDHVYQLLWQDDIARAQCGLHKNNQMLVTMNDQLYIPNDSLIRYKLVLEYHDNPFNGHWDGRKTLQLLQNHYFWPTMQSDVLEVIETCDPCQRSKIARTKDQAPIRFIEAQYPWEIVTIDFISGFVATKRKHTAVCVICDRFTRMVHMESCLDHATAKDTAKIAIRQIFAKHGCPRIIISDRGTQFDSELWKHLWNFMGTRIHLASIHYPQTNGLTERMNRTLINLIKKMTQKSTHEWDSKLPLFEFAYNITPNSTTGTAPFLANQGYLPSTPVSLLAVSTMKLPATRGIRQFIEDIQRTYLKIHKQIQEEELKARKAIEERLSHKRGHPQYVPRDEVLVFWAPFETYNTLPRKHRFRYEGPFIVKQVINHYCVVLDGLPPKMPNTINIEYIHLYKRTTQPALHLLREMKE